MKQVAQLADQVREQRQPAAPDNPWLKWQEMVSDGIIAVLDGYRDQRDAQMEKIFLAIYDSPVLQAMLGTGVDGHAAAAAGPRSGAHCPYPAPHRRAEGRHHHGGAARSGDQGPALCGHGGARRR
jgi:hypothetical protein